MEIISRKKARELGLKRYYTGKPCRYGHICERYLSTNGCVKCLSISTAEWNIDNKEWKKNYGKKRCSTPEFKEKHRIESREFHRKNKIRLNSIRVEKNKKNFDFKRRKIKSAMKYIENVIRKQPTKKYLYAVACGHNYRFKKIGIRGIINVKDLLVLLEKQNGKCNTCFDSIYMGYIHYDHIMPIPLGGTNEKENGQFLCPPCNYLKNDKHPDVFLECLKRVKREEK